MLTRSLILLALGASLARAQAPAPRASAATIEAIRSTGLNYVEGFYEGDTAKLIRGLHPELSKYGFWRDTTGKWSGERMTFTEAVAYARRVKARNAPVRPEWPKEVQVLDVLDRTAVEKVTAWWGYDYLLLGNFDGEWKILQVIWEGPLRK